ncbi:MAG TPA: outer membrane protein assembly factor BamA [Longimicrobiales bacterium]|nr:outer membrane protein assembly factor BamA [Longimicrobiales bacterium]
MKQQMQQLIHGAAALAAASVLTLGSPALAGAQETPAPAVEPVLVEAIEVRGNARIPDDVILSTTGIQLGDRVTFREIQQAIRRLWVTDQYEDVRVFAEEIRPEEVASPVRLIIEVDEQPYVAYVEFRGLEHVRPSAIRDTVGLRGGQAYDPARLTEAEYMIREMLAEQGIRLRGVEHRLEPIAGVEDEYRLVIDVEEGQRVAIADIVIEGNEVFSDDDIEDAMSTRSEGFLWFRPGLFDENVLRTDLRANLPAFYGEHGYIDFRVLGDTLEVDPETGKGRLTIRVDEGPRYRLVDFEVRGNHRFSREELSRYYESARGGLLSSFGIGGIGAEEGQVASRQPVFNRARFEQATEDVSQQYRNQGYLYAQVVPFVERVETERGEPGVRVGWDIAEREPAYVNRVAIVGNTYTHESVIRDRIFVLPGDVYSEEMLIQSYRSIMGLGFFESPLPTPRMEQLPSGDVDVVFEVKEKQTGSIGFGTTIGGWGGIAGFLSYDHPNLFGQAKAGHLRWEFGSRYNNFSTSYTDPSIRGSQLSGSASLFSSKENRFFAFPEGERRRTGGSLRFGFPFPLDRRFSRVFAGYQLSRTEYTNFGDEEGSIFGLPPGLLSTVTFSLLRNTLDSPLFPTVGTRNELRAELSGGPLGGDGDFQKYTATGSWWVPVAALGGDQVGVRPVRMALGMTAEAGAIFGDASRFPFEQFWMGGVQFGQNLRGYDETTITPLGYIPSRSGIPLANKLGKSYVRLSAEYAIRFNDNVSVSAFGDAGNLWRDPLEVNPSKLFRGAGVGVQLVTPFGPMGLDYAYGFDKTDPGWQLHFKFGQTN